MAARLNRQFPEAALHRAVAEFLGWILHPPIIWTTLPVGGGGRVRGAQLKAMGVKKGWPDILIIAPGPIVLGIELKAPKGRQSFDQFSVETCFKDCKASYFLCRSVEDVQRAIEFVKIPVAPYNKAA